MKPILACLLGAASALACACGGIDNGTTPTVQSSDSGSGGGSAAAGSGAGGGTSSAGATSATDAPTFTDVYTLLDSSCSGSRCHDPGRQAGVSLTSQATAYTSVSGYVTPGTATRSTLYAVLSRGSMPPGGPRLSSADLKMIADWIDAGALDD
jgi:hypothetical protein